MIYLRALWSEGAGIMTETLDRLLRGLSSFSQAGLKLRISVFNIVSTQYPWASAQIFLDRNVYTLILCVMECFQKAVQRIYIFTDSQASPTALQSWRLKSGVV